MGVEHVARNAVLRRPRVIFYKHFGKFTCHGTERVRRLQGNSMRTAHHHRGAHLPPTCAVVHQIQECVDDFGGIREARTDIRQHPPRLWTVRSRQNPLSWEVSKEFIDYDASFDRIRLGFCQLQLITCCASNLTDLTRAVFR